MLERVVGNEPFKQRDVYKRQGADMNQTMKAITEAESYHGPSLIIGYAPCEMHGVKGGMTNCQAEMKKARCV